MQARFVDNPEGLITEASQLMGEVMSTRGYPVSDFEWRGRIFRWTIHLVLENYRAVHEIVQRHAQGQASMEDLRQAMIHYRMLFEELIGQLAVADANDAA